MDQIGKAKRLAHFLKSRQKDSGRTNGFKGTPSSRLKLPISNATPDAIFIFILTQTA